MSKVQITEGVIWYNTLKLHEQSEEAQGWYNETIATKLSYVVPITVKQAVADKLGLSGTIPKEAEIPEKIAPSTFDVFGRPSTWKFYKGSYMVTVENKYLNHSVNWNIDCITVKIEEVK